MTKAYQGKTPSIRRNTASWRESMVAQALNNIGGIFAKAPANGLRGVIQNLLHELQATAAALVVESDGALRVEHREPGSERARSSLRCLLANQEIRAQVHRFAQGREDFFRFECSPVASCRTPWHEALFIRLPPFGFSQQSSSAFFCVVDRLVGRGPDEALTIQSARYLVIAVTSLFRRLDAHIGGVERLGVSLPREVGASAHSVLQSSRETVIDSGLGILDDESVVEECAPLMQLAHVARLHRELVAHKPEREPVCRDLLEKGWTQGLSLRKVVGIDRDVRSGKTAVKAVLDWTRLIDPNPAWLAGARNDAAFLSSLRALFPELVTAARIEADPTVALGERSLGCYLLAHIADWPKERKEYWLSGAPSSEEFHCSVSSVARLVHHVIGRAPMGPETIQAYIWAISEYSHKTLRLPAQFDLRGHLGLAERQEPVLHGLRRFYRNHFFHSMEVCLLGHFLLELTTNGVPLWRRIARVIPSCRGSKERVLRLWYLTALLHDVGYVVEVAKGTADLFQMYSKSDVLADLASGIKATIAKASVKLAKDGFQDYSAEDAPAEDHGVIGARHLQVLLASIAKEDAKFDAKDYAGAVRAIALHNSQKHVVHFSTDPLAFLLVLCDTLQEWSRPAVSFSTIGSEVGAWLMAPDSPHPRPSQPFCTGRLGGIERSSDGKMYKLAVGDTLAIGLDYNEGILKNWGVYNLWLSCSYNLQRLDLTGLGFNIDFSVTTPFGRTTSMHSLRDAARDTHMVFLDKWFPNHPIGGNTFTNGYVQHRQGVSCETLTLHLKSLASAKPLTKNMTAFRDAMKRWRHRDDGWDYGGDYAFPDSLD